MEKKIIFNLSNVIFVVSILAFLSDLSNSITSVTVPLLALNLGASVEFVGTMVALSSMIRLLLVQPVGILCDKIDKRIFLFLGFVSYLIYFLFLIFATSPIHILLGRIFQGIGSAMFYTAAISLILVNAGENTGLAVGVYATTMGVGFSIGPIIGGFIAEKMGYDMSYIFSIIIATFAIVLLVLVLKENKLHLVNHSKLKTDDNISYKLLLKNKELLIACIGAFFISEAIGADTSFFPVLGRELALPEGIIGTILGIRALLSTIVRIPIGKATERISAKKLMMIALGLASLGLFLVPQFRIVWLFPIFLGLEGIGYGIFLTSANIYIGEVTSEENRGAAVGLYNTFSGLGGVLNMTILGLIAGSFGVANTFRFTSIMCLLGLILINTLSMLDRKIDITK